MADILVAEDEDILRRNLTFILNSYGYAAQSKRTSFEAIEILKRRKFDLVITDLIMPDKGGGELIKYVSENCPEIPIIVITAYPSTDSAIDAVKKGVVDYFTKPFKTEDMLDAVKKALERKKEIPIIWDKISSYGITRREKELLKVIIEEGITGTREIMDRLSIKETTLKTYLANLYGKFEAKDKVSLVSAVIRVLRKP